jgi:6-phosphogluconolactonase
MKPEIVVLSDPNALAHEAARRFADLAVRAVDFRGRFSIALSGGSTPLAMYRLLAEDPYRGQIPWKGVHLFWGDERCVPPADPSSNFRAADEAFISRVPLPRDNVHRVRGELGPEVAARAYANALDDFFCGPHARLDLVLLGLGDDGHMASLFPGSDALQESTRLTAAVEAYYQDRPAGRVTLTLPAVNAARHVLFLVTGSAKAQIVQAMLEGDQGSYPARQVRPTAGELTWLLDRAAASRLQGEG